MITMTAYAEEAVKAADLLKYQIVDGKSVTAIGYGAIRKLRRLYAAIH